MGGPSAGRRNSDLTKNFLPIIGSMFFRSDVSISVPAIGKKALVPPEAYAKFAQLRETLGFTKV